jgi:hypothetical protein
MADRLPSQNFYSMLVDETCEITSQADENGSVTSFEEYFERKSATYKANHIEELLLEKKLSYSKAIDYKEAGIYRFKFGAHLLDFPKNWSFFCHRIRAESTGMLLIDQNNDPDLLLNITSEIFSFSHQLAFLSYGGAIFFVALKGNEGEALIDFFEGELLKKAA